uniref:Uncharacterized protein n=1 Tax=Heterorhabditis bacteriophora TaxID=37862 RepID=A0A1I7WR63_HETBA
MPINMKIFLKHCIPKYKRKKELIIH